ncbi:hypothetical protein Patl1_23172 [Pistacia atlantica]|uniref:Uncharacterized protein n=1 Tax=Pistacia atlantica TaxID=434234 RepID=A0ACC1A1W3_9ROSI|nr:hypothetical protein Patl1_23172 [Pistacia atlantica]
MRQNLRIRNKPQGVTVECLGEGCKWRIHASVMIGTSTFQVRTKDNE